MKYIYLTFLVAFQRRKKGIPDAADKTLLVELKKKKKK